MLLIEQVRTKLTGVLEKHEEDKSTVIAVVPLSPEDAIGDQVSDDFPIKVGKERVIEACYGKARGQAFTDAPSKWKGTVQELLDLDLSNSRRRAVFIASLNAICRRFGIAKGTVHCKQNDPLRCGPKAAAALYERFGDKKIGLIGLQPAILAGCAEQFGVENVRAIDLNPDNIGKVKSGITIGDGNSDLEKLLEWCDVGLCTGSTIVNGTIDNIKGQFDKAEKPIVFFGNTISAAAMMLGLDHLCPLSF